MARRIVYKSLLPVIILAVGLGLGAWFMTNPDEAQKGRKPEAQALLVETGHAEDGTFPAYIEAMGQVRPAREVTLKARVAGEIVSTAPEFIPGGHFAQGEEILKIDPADYALAVQKQKAVLAQAKADYDLEMGRQSVAQDELAIIERTTGRKPESPDLALRKPQLAQAQAELKKAGSDLETAQLNLSRTSLQAPFNALVTARAAVAGDKISSGETLATIVSTDEYWIEISVPVHDLAWLDIPQKSGEQGSAATIILDGGRGERTGNLLRLTGALDAESRLATLLVSVPEPLRADEGPPLILGDYARVVLQGKTMDGALRVPLGWVRDGNIVWVRKDGRLTYNPVSILYEDRQYAYIGAGLSKDDEIVASDIAVPAEGMKIRTPAEARSDVMDKMQSSRGLGK